MTKRRSWLLPLNRAILEDLKGLKPKTMSEEYLTQDQAEDRQKQDGVRHFRRRIHHFSPAGLGPRFKWSAIVAWLEERDKPVAEQPADSIPMARGYLLGTGKK